jgi:hypothetical protein
MDKDKGIMLHLLAPVERKPSSQEVLILLRNPDEEKENMDKSKTGNTTAQTQD